MMKEKLTFCRATAVAGNSPTFPCPIAFGGTTPASSYIAAAGHSVECHGRDYYNTANNHLPDCGYVDERHSRQQHADENRPERADKHTAGAAGQADASDHHRSDNVEFVTG